MRYIRLAIILLLAVSSIGQVTAAPGSQEQRVIASFFGETQNWIAPPFYDFWDQNGGLPIFGYPLAPTDLMVSADDGNTYATQIFERNRFEYHPENSEPYRILLILLGRLGLKCYDNRAETGKTFPKVNRSKVVISFRKQAIPSASHFVATGAATVSIWV